MTDVRLYLVKPTADDEQAVWEYRATCDIPAGSQDIPGSCRLREAASFAAWFARVEQIADASRTPEGHVAATTYLAKHVEDGRLIGTIQIRHGLTPHLLEFGGHIGYSVAPRERGHGYGTEMLGLALDKCEEMGISPVLVTCKKPNVASAKVIQANGGKLENEVQEGEFTVQRYWIGDV